MNVQEARNQQEWDTFLSSQTYRPFLQSWTMGEVYRDTEQEPIRLEVRENGAIVAICQAILVPAKRGRHLSIPYGPVINYQLPTTNYQLLLDSLIEELKKVAREHQCAFIRMSPFWAAGSALPAGARLSPLHLLAEHIWYLPLVEPDPWSSSLVLTSIPRPLPPREEGENAGSSQTTTNIIHSPSPVERGLGGEVEFKREIQLKPRTEEELLSGLRKTTRNLVRRAERDGVTIEASADPNREIGHFLSLHEETRHRHGFTPYTDAFFRAQVRRFAERGEATLYLARFQGEVAAASIHMHAFGETSYHHGASTHRLALHSSEASSAGLSKIPASYLLQWTAIRDALRRGDHVYNFWGIAPTSDERLAVSGEHEEAQLKAQSSKLKAHPFAGVTLFKTGFGGQLLPLVHCMDFPLTTRYHLTRAVELIRKWRRGF